MCTELSHNSRCVGIKSYHPSTMSSTQKILLLLSTLYTLLLTSTPTSLQNYQIATDHCTHTPYPDFCSSTLTQLIPDLHTRSLPNIICAVLNHTESAVMSSSSKCSSLINSTKAEKDRRQPIALTDCMELFDQTLSELNQAIVDLESDRPEKNMDDMRTMLSAAITNQYTCLDGFSHVKKSCNLRPVIESRLYNISRLVSNSLAMVKKIHGKKNRTSEVFEEYGEVKNGFPEWISRSDQKLLANESAAAAATVVVAKDGSGNFKTIMEAVNAAPDKSKSRIIIHIKAGLYLENVDVVKKKTNLMFQGDGIGKTVIRASRNVVDGSTTYRSATVAIEAPNFIARDLTVENTAGPSKHQAVALRSNGDFSAFYKCSFVGYQDTLYTHSMRQFYRECDVYGTVDFIFGNAAVVLQNCNLYARKPNPNQKNIFTAQGRIDPNQNTGISIQNCNVAAASDLVPVQSNFKSYLGRPWKLYSRTVYMESNIGSLIDPAGWLEWDGNFALDTLYYAEYNNRGAGAGTSGRVKWKGYRVINAAEASKFTVSNFIEGEQWLGSIPYTAGL